MITDFEMKFPIWLKTKPDYEIKCYSYVSNWNNFEVHQMCKYIFWEKILQKTS